MQLTDKSSYINIIDGIYVLDLYRDMDDKDILDDLWNQFMDYCFKQNIHFSYVVGYQLRKTLQDYVSHAGMDYTDYYISKDIFNKIPTP